MKSDSLRKGGTSCAVLVSLYLYHHYIVCIAASLFLQNQYATHSTERKNIHIQTHTPSIHHQTLQKQKLGEKLNW
jgi:hypothetical protein